MEKIKAYPQRKTPSLKGKWEQRKEGRQDCKTTRKTNNKITGISSCLFIIMLNINELNPAIE